MLTMNFSKAIVDFEDAPVYKHSKLIDEEAIALEAQGKVDCKIFVDEIFLSMCFGKTDTETGADPDEE